MKTHTTKSYRRRSVRLSAQTARTVDQRLKGTDVSFSEFARAAVRREIEGRLLDAPAPLSTAETQRLRTVARKLKTTPADAGRAILRSALGFEYRDNDLEFKLVDVCNSLGR